MLGKRKEREEDSYLEILCSLKIYDHNKQEYSFSRFEKNIVCNIIWKKLKKAFSLHSNYILDDLDDSIEGKYFYLCYDEFKSDKIRQIILNTIKDIGKNHNKIILYENIIYWQFDIIDVNIL